MKCNDEYQHVVPTSNECFDPNLVCQFFIFLTRDTAGIAVSLNNYILLCDAFSLNLIINIVDINFWFSNYFIK